VRKECKRNELRVNAGKRAAKFEEKMDGREECRILAEYWKEGKKHGEEGEREILPEERVCQWRSGKIESKRKMDECRTEWKGQRHRKARKNRKNQRIQIQQGVWKVYDRGNFGGPGERESAKERKMMARFSCANKERENRY
jgi:hypothetical protein